MKPTLLAACLTACLAVPATAGVNVSEYLANKKAQVEAEARAQAAQNKLYENARTVGMGENLGRDKKSDNLNYVLYGGRRTSAAGKTVLVLHKIERGKVHGGVFSAPTGGDSFIISYEYEDPDEIYLQGDWLKVLEFDNVQMRFVVLEGREAISRPGGKPKEPAVQYRN